MVKAVDCVIVVSEFELQLKDSFGIKKPKKVDMPLSKETK